MSELPTLSQIQEQTRQALAKVLGIEVEDVKKEVSNTAEQQEIKLRVAKQLEDGTFINGFVIIRQTGRKHFQVAGRITEGSDSYIIGKEIHDCQVTSLPQMLVNVISESRSKRPDKKKSLFGLIKK